MKPTLKLLTVFCYFLPFVFFVPTCNGLENLSAYNETEAQENQVLAEEPTATQMLPANDSDTTAQPELTHTTQAKKIVVIPSANSNGDSDNAKGTLAEYPSKWDAVFMKIVRPTGKSVSALGAIVYFKNEAGQIMVGASFLLSLALLMPWFFAKRTDVRDYLFMANIVCVVAFIINCFVSDVTMLWGVWILMALLLVQLFVEVYQRKSSR